MFFKKLVRLIKSLSNDAIDRTYDPIRDLRQAERDIDEEITRLMARAVDIQQSLQKNKHKQNEYKEQATKYLDQARDFKRTGDDHRGITMLQRSQRLEQQSSEFKEMISTQSEYYEKLRGVITDLELKKSEIEFETQMLADRKDLADSNINYHNRINGTTCNKDSIKEAINRAREEIASIEHRSTAYNTVAEDFDRNNDQSVSASQEAKSAYARLSV